jgi:hypothetical protein
MLPVPRMLSFRKLNGTIAITVLIAVGISLSARKHVQVQGSPMGACADIITPILIPSFTSPARGRA